MPQSSGNAFFLILIAVALFAALSYAITSTSRSGAGNLSKETAESGAARLLNFETALRGGMMRLTATNGVPATSVQFNNDIYVTYAGAPMFTAMGTPTNPSLYIFHPLGGGVSPQTFIDLSIPCPPCSTNKVKSGHLQIQWNNVPDVGTSVADLAVYVSSLNPAVCQALNEKLGISGIPVLNLQTAGYSNQATPPIVAATTGSTPADLDAVRGRNSFCYKEDSANARYIFDIILTNN